MLRRFGAPIIAMLALAACTSDDPVSTVDDDATEADDDTTAASAEQTADDGSNSDSSGAAGGSSSGNPSPTGGAPFEPDPIEWTEQSDQIDDAIVRVPVDYDDPNGDQFELYVARYRALDPDERIGSLLVNPGGPGFGGSDFAVFAAQIFDQELLRHFDIVGWDPRGVGESTPAIDCIDDYDPFFNEIDSTPETPEEHDRLVATSQAFADACTANNATIIDQVGTNNSARDIDSIRRALGEDTISYFGFSYGSELGATWATLFPDTVRAAVLDGASDPEADPIESTLQQLTGFSDSLDSFLAACSADRDCEFHNDGDAEGAIDELLASLDAEPLAVPGDRPPVNRDVATTAIVQALYDDAFWPALERSLSAAQQSDGTGLLALSDAYYQRSPEGTFGNELEAFRVIGCADNDERRTIEEIDAESALYTEVAPRLAPEGSAGGYFCTFLPEAGDPRVSIDTTGVGPIVVIGTTGDPATPFDSTVRMSDTLADGRLVIVDANQHTGYGVNRCVVDVVNDYLIDLDAPADQTTC